jgi:hypothetical protein
LRKGSLCRLLFSRMYCRQHTYPIFKSRFLFVSVLQQSRAEQHPSDWNVYPNFFITRTKVSKLVRQFVPRGRFVHS